MTMALTRNFTRTGEEQCCRWCSSDADSFQLAGKGIFFPATHFGLGMEYPAEKSRDLVIASETKNWEAGFM